MKQTPIAILAFVLFLTAEAHAQVSYSIRHRVYGQTVAAVNKKTENKGFLRAATYCERMKKSVRNVVTSRTAVLPNPYFRKSCSGLGNKVQYIGWSNDPIAVADPGLKVCTNVLGHQFYTTVTTTFQCVR